MKTSFTITILALILSTSVFAENRSLPAIMATRPQVGAHRGGGLSPERNTMIQFKRAYDAKADIIETDLRLTKDGVVVVFHDELMSKSTKCGGLLSDYTLAELRKCPFKGNKEAIPTFEELLQWSVGRVIVNAEFKAQATIKPAIALMQKYNGQEWVYFQTQERRKSYEIARAADPHAYLIFYAIKQSELNWALSFNDPYLFAIELNPKLHNPVIVRQVQAQGKLASANSFQIVRDEEKSGVAGCHLLLDLGFDILITDQTASCVDQRDDR